MTNRLKSWIIHKLGGCTKKDVEYLNNQQLEIVYKQPKIEKFRFATYVPRYSDFNLEEMSYIVEQGLPYEIGRFIIERHLYKMEKRENHRGDTECVYTVRVIVDD